MKGGAPAIAPALLAGVQDGACVLWIHIGAAAARLGFHSTSHFFALEKTAKVVFISENWFSQFGKGESQCDS